MVRRRKEAEGRAGSEPGHRMASVLHGLKTVLLLVLLLASALPGDCARRDPHSMEEISLERHRASHRHQMRQPRVENGQTIQVVDFSADSDHQLDDDGQYTGASVHRGRGPRLASIEARPPSTHPHV
jgi:hypothetical protein